MPLDGSAAARHEVGAIADALSREYGLRGLNGFDFILRNDRPVVVEVNPRYCASMELLERASGRSVFALHLAACRGELPERVGEPTEIWGKAIVYASRTVTVPDTTEWLAQGVRDVPHPGELIRAGHPICTVLASAPTRSRCETALQSEAARLRAACTPTLRADAMHDASNAYGHRRLAAPARTGPRSPAVTGTASFSARGCRPRASSP